jgi:hypothetical protein
LTFSGDGTIDESEFKSLCVSYGLSSEESAEAYNKFTSVSNLIHCILKYYIHISKYCPSVSTYDQLKKKKSTMRMVTKI